MFKIKFRIISVLILAIMFFNSLAVFAEDIGDSTLVVKNSFVQFTVNKDNGRFAIRTAEGSPIRDEDNDKPLLYEKDAPDTSFTTFLIDGKEYIYGNNYGFLGLGNNVLEQPTTNGLANESKWTVNGVEVTQTLLVVDNSDNKNVGNVKIQYKVKNTSGKAITLGTRMLFDTFVGDNDASPVMLPGQNGYISKEKALSGADTPLYWKAVDNVDAPKVVSFGLLGGWQNVVPDKVTFAHWESLSHTKWNYTPDENLDFTSTGNRYDSADSAVALYWNPATIAAGEEKTFETYYGIGDISTEGDKATFTARCFGPEKLEVNSTGTGYVQSTFNVGMQIDNTFTQSQILKNVKAKIEYGYGMKLAAGETSEKTIETIGINEIKNISFALQPVALYKTSIPVYKITLTADGLNTPIEKTGTILIPSLTGEPPSISFTGYAPSKLYYADDAKSITIAGKGFDLLAQDENYSLKLTNLASNEATVIPKANIKVSSESMIVSIPNSLANACKIGSYKVTVSYSYQGESRNFDFQAALSMSNDTSFRVLKYKVLQVLRKKANDKYTYSINESASDTVAASTDANTTVMLEFRGDIEKLDNIYTIKSTDTFINSMVKYRYSLDDTLISPRPIQIMKHGPDVTHYKDYISIIGSGYMYLGQFPFCIGGFSIELEDNTMYTVEPEKTGEEDGKKIEVVPTFFGLKVPNVEGLPITVKRAVLAKDFVSFGGALDFGAFLNSMTGVAFPKEKKKDSLPTGIPDINSPNAGKPETKEEEAEGGNIAFALAVDELRFGVSSTDKNVVEFKGINANGKVGIPKDITSKIIPGAEIGAEVSVMFNTIGGYQFEIGGSFDFFVISAGAVIKMKSFDVNGVPVFFPDKAEVYGGFEAPGIPIIPVMPVAYITKLGGGFDNLFDTVTGNFQLLPPLNLRAIAGLSIAKIFTADRINLDVSLRGLGLTAEDMKIANLKILKKVSLKFALADTLLKGRVKFDITGTAEVDIFGVITGDGGLYFGIDSAKNGNLGPISLGGYVNGSVQIPPYVPVFGGLKFGSASAGISDESVYASVKFLNIIPIGIKYVWGASAPILTSDSKTNRDMVILASNGDIPDGILSGTRSNYFASTDYVSKEDGTKGTVIYGDNIRVRGKSSVRSFAHVIKPKNYASAGGFDGYSMEYLAQAGSTDYKFSFANGQQYGLVSVSYEDDLPVLTLTDPDGLKVPLAEGENYLLQTINADVSESGKIEKRAVISFVNPKSGEWTLTSSEEVDLQILDVSPVPELNTLNASMVAGKVNASWTGKDMGSTEMFFYLCKNNTDDTGTLVNTEGIPATNGTAVLDVPAKINSGEYYLRAELKDSTKNYSSIYAATKLTIIDPNKPANPANLQVTTAGDGLLNISWDKSTDAEGYYLEVFDEAGTSQGVIEIKDGAAEQKLIGGKIKTSAVKDENGNIIIPEKEGGIIPGNKYRIRLTAFRTTSYVDGGNTYQAAHLTIPLESGLVAVPIPDPADIDLEPQAISGTLQSKTDGDGNSYYVTNEDSVNLHFTSSQNGNSIVTVNDVDVALVSGDDWTQKCELQEGDNTIFIFFTNGNGDTTKTAIKIKKDTVAPELKIDNPQPGAVVTGSTVSVRGFSEIGSTITVNGKPVEKGADNVFSTTVDMGQDLCRDIVVVAQDEALNKTEYRTTVFNNNLTSIKRVVLKAPKSMEINDLEEMSLCVVDENGKEARISPNVVKWEILRGKSAASISSSGKVKALADGKATIRASFAIASDFAYEDSAIIDVGKSSLADINSLQITPSEISLQVGETKQLLPSLLREDMSVEDISPGSVQWEIVTDSNSSISLSSSGIIKALKKGTAVIKAVYTAGDKEYKTQALVSVTGDNVTNISKDVSDTDKIILEVLSMLNDEAKKKTVSISSVFLADYDDVTGTALGRIDESTFQGMLDKAVSIEAGGDKAIIEFKVDAPQNSIRITAEIPENVFDRTADSTKAEIKVNTSIGSITFNAKAVDAISENSAQGNINISIAKVDTSTLTDAMQKKAGDNPVYDLSVTAGSTVISSFDQGRATVEVPYTLKAGEDPDSIVVYYIDSKGNLSPVRGKYDLVSHTVRFTVGHFSNYMIGYNKKSFTDVKDTAWYAKAVSFIAARDITIGKGNGRFGPDDKLTRGQYIVMMMKAYGLMPDSNPIDNFADGGDTYYTGYLAAAKRLGIAVGTGNNLFSPEKAITRQDMLTLLYKALVLLDELPGGTTGKPMSSFGDAGNVSDYAREAIAVFTKTGVISGSGGMIRPKDYTTRAQMAQVLYSLLGK